MLKVISKFMASPSLEVREFIMARAFIELDHHGLSFRRNDRGFYIGTSKLGY